VLIRVNSGLYIHMLRTQIIIIIVIIIIIITIIGYTNIMEGPMLNHHFHKT